MANIDDVLASIGTGRYQITSLVLLGLILMYSNVSPMAYVFTAGDMKYRCEVPECDPANAAERTYEPEWLRFTTPYRNDTGQPLKCKRFAALSGPVNGTRCARAEFDAGAVERCRGSWVFEDPENTIGTEFGLLCEDNRWKLSMVGTINNIGQFIGMPISGVIADKFGRKFTMILCAALSAGLCIIQSFSVNYLMFLVLELLSSIVAGGIYTVTFILAMEMFVPDQRVLMYSILECFLPIGSVMVAVVASQVKDWKLLLRITNIPGLLFVSYFWLTEESLRWLEMQGKHDQVIVALKKISTINKKTFPDIPPNTQIQKSDSTGEKDADVKHCSILKDIIRSSIIFWRMIRCSSVWIAVTLVYYGLTINATEIAGNKYLNFILVSIVEIPACLFNWVIMEGMSRKISLSSMFVLSGICCIVYNLMSDDLHLLKLFVFMVSKLGISIAFSIIYMLTTEIFPTKIRVTMVSICSMLSRIGSILAPQTMLLKEYFDEYIIMLLFGLTAFIAAVITMTLPESKNIKLPDTINEAEQIGADVKPQNSVNSIT